MHHAEAWCMVHIITIDEIAHSFLASFVLTTWPSC
jgi:hypothetical protein